MLVWIVSVIVLVALFGHMFGLDILVGGFVKGLVK